MLRAVHETKLPPLVKQLLSDLKKSASKQLSGNGTIRKKFPLHKPRGGKKLKWHLRYYYTKKTYRKQNEQVFSNRRSLIRTELKIWKRTQGSNSTTIRLQNTKQLEQQQKYRLGTISNTKFIGWWWCLNRFYRRLTSPSSSAVVHNI